MYAVFLVNKVIVKYIKCPLITAEAFYLFISLYHNGNNDFSLVWRTFLLTFG